MTAKDFYISPIESSGTKSIFFANAAILLRTTKYANGAKLDGYLNQVEIQTYKFLDKTLSQ